MEWIDNVLRDVAELPDRNSPEDWPEAMLVTGDELRQIIVTHAPAEPVNARLLAALKRLSFCAQTTGGVAGRDDELCSAIEASAKAIAEAEAKQVEPVRLTNADIVGLIQAWNATDFSGVVDLILSVESAVLRRNGINPQAKGD